MIEIRKFFVFLTCLGIIILVDFHFLDVIKHRTRIITIVHSDCDVVVLNIYQGGSILLLMIHVRLFTKVVHCSKHAMPVRIGAVVRFEADCPGSCWIEPQFVPDCCPGCSGMIPCWLCRRCTRDLRQGTTCLMLLRDLPCWWWACRRANLSFFDW